MRGGSGPARLLPATLTLFRLGSDAHVDGTGPAPSKRENVLFTPKCMGSAAHGKGTLLRRTQGLLGVTRLTCRNSSPDIWQV